MIRFTPSLFLVVLAWWPTGAFAQKAGQSHYELPLLAETMFLEPLRNPVGDIVVPLDEEAAGLWTDVRFISFYQPMVRFSALRRGEKTPAVCEAHILTLPPALRAKVSAFHAGKTPKSALFQKILLPDGHVLENANPVSIEHSHVVFAHSKGQTTVPINDLDPPARRKLRIPLNRVFEDEVILADGRKFTRVTLEMRDDKTVSLLHEGGAVKITPALLPETMRLACERVFTDAPKPTKKSKPDLLQAVAPPPQKTEETKPTYDIALRDGRVYPGATIIQKDEHLLRIAYRDQSGPQQANIPTGDLNEATLDLLKLEKPRAVRLVHEILEKGLVCYGRTPLMELIPPEQKAKDTPWQDIAAGRSFGDVRTGFIVLWEGSRSREGVAVNLLKELGGKKNAYVDWKNVYFMGAIRARRWWNPERRDELGHIEIEPYQESFIQEYFLTPSTVVLDPFTARQAVASNREGALLKAWVLPRKGQPPLGIVETAAGYFLGFLVERNALAGAAMTWPQALSDASRPYEIKQISQKELGAGNKIYQLADFSDPVRRDRGLNSPDKFRVLPSHYENLLQEGMPGLMVALEAPADPGYETPQEEIGENPAGLEIQSVTEKVTLHYASSHTGKTLLKLTREVNERTIERVTRNGKMTETPSPWKKTKSEKILEFDNDLDGAVRVTDGEMIYEIATGGTRPVLSIYEVKPNKLYNKKVY